MKEDIKEERDTLIENIYEHPIISCILFSTICGGIAKIVSAVKFTK